MEIIKSQTDVGKSLCAILIIIHHWEQIANIYLLDFLKYIGVFVCIAFFFMSSYGLTKSYLNNSQRNKWRGRFNKIVIPYLLANILYLIVFSFLPILKMNISIIDVLWVLVGVKLMNGHLWFMQALIIQYIGFYFVCKYLFSKSFFLKFLCLLLFAGIYLVIARSMGALSVLGFVGGYLYACKESVLPRWSINQYLIFILFLSSIFSLYLIYYQKVPFFPLFPFVVLSFILVIYNFLLRIKWCGKVWQLFSALSFSLYMMNAFALHVYIYLYRYSGLNMLVCTLLYIIANFIFALIFNRLLKFMKGTLSCS